MNIESLPDYYARIEGKTNEELLREASTLALSLGAKERLTSEDIDMVKKALVQLESLTFPYGDPRQDERKETQRAFQALLVRYVDAEG